MLIMPIKPVNAATIPAKQYDVTFLEYSFYPTIFAGFMEQALT